MFFALLERTVWLLILILRCVIVPINQIIHMKKPQPLPKIRSHLLLESASSLARMIRKRQVTSEEVVQAYISRIRDVNPFINAVVEDRFEQAVQESRLTDTLIQSRMKSEEELEESLPFLGVPFSVKESIAVQGSSHTAGEYQKKGRLAKEDAVAVGLMKATGAIPLVLSNTPELCTNWETFNQITGLTRNPYDTRRTPGGSSGGEAALLASAASVIGLGSDVAGSARLPAFFTGTFGHKPTPGVVSIDGHIPSALDKDWVKYFSICPMARYAEDLLPMLKALANENVNKLQLDTKVDLKKIKIYYMEDDAGSVSSNAVHPELTGAMRSAVAYLEAKHDIRAKEVCFANLKHGFEFAVIILGLLDGVTNVFQKTDDDAKEWNSVIKECVKYLCCRSKVSPSSIGYGMYKKILNLVPQENLMKLQDKVAKLHNEIKEVLGTDGVLLYPSFTDFAHYHYEISFRFLNTTYMMVWNILELPVTQCPLGLGRKGLPMGVQLVGAPLSDRLTIAVAKDLEAGFGGWVPPPKGVGVGEVSATPVSKHCISTIQNAI